MLSQSSPLSMLRFAMFLILARLPCALVGLQCQKEGTTCLPVLEPNLHRPLGHVDVLRDAFSNQCRGRRVLVEFDLQRHELILCRSLPLLVLLLLCEGTLARRSP